MSLSTVDPVALANSIVVNPLELARLLYTLRGEIETRLAAAEAAVTAAGYKRARLATTAALAANTRTGNVLLADANGALGNIDGVAPAVGNRLLVKHEGGGASHANNGLWAIDSLGGGGSKWQFTRVTDANTSAEVLSGMSVVVAEGTANAGSGWLLTTADPITLNTTPLEFVRIPMALATAAPANVTKAAAAVGTSSLAARGDHKHDVTTAAAGAIAIGDVAAEGASASLARADHTHSVAAPAAPADVTKAAASAGAAVTFSRADHKHDVTTAAPVAIGASGSAAAEGAATSLSRSNHVHPPNTQTGQLTLIAGTKTINTVITITANSKVFYSLVTPGAGASGTRYKTSGLVVGGAGVGTFVVTAVDSGAGDNIVNTDVSVLDFLIVD